MRKSRYVRLVLAALLTSVLSWAVPTEDLTETSYDESQSLPYQISAPTSADKPQRIPSVDPALLTGHDHPAPDSFRSITLDTGDAQVSHRFGETATALAFLCFFLC